MYTCMWTSQDTFTYHSSGAVQLVLWDRISYWPGTCWLGDTGWPVSSIDPPASTCSLLGLQVHTKTCLLFLHKFYRRNSVLGHLINVFPSFPLSLELSVLSHCKHAGPHFLSGWIKFCSHWLFWLRSPWMVSYFNLAQRLLLWWHHFHHVVGGSESVWWLSFSSSYNWALCAWSCDKWREDREIQMT